MKPWMHQKEIDMVLSYLTNSTDKIMLEWGSGGSTLLFSQHVKKYYSIEHNLDWYYEVRNKLVSDDINNVVHHLNDYPKGRSEVYDTFFKKWEELILQVSGETTNNYFGIKEYPNPKEMYIWYDYVNVIDKFNEPHFDFVFIDGRARVNCAYKALKYIDENSIIFIHDFYKKEELPDVLEFYEIIDSVEDTLQTIAVLKKKI